MGTRQSAIVPAYHFFASQPVPALFLFMLHWKTVICMETDRQHLAAAEQSKRLWILLIEKESRAHRRGVVEKKAALTGEE